MKNQEIKSEIIRIIENMEQNTYLLPDGWSGVIQMASRDASYKTYVGGRAGSRYITIEYTTPKGKIDINFRKKDVMLSDVDIFTKTIKPSEILDIVKAIYEEKYSFIDGVKGLARIRKEIREKRDAIRRDKKELEVLNARLADYLKLKKEKQDVKI